MSRPSIHPICPSEYRRRVVPLAASHGNPALADELANTLQRLEADQMEGWRLMQARMAEDDSGRLWLNVALKQTGLQESDNELPGSAESVMMKLADFRAAQASPPVSRMPRAA